MLRVLQVGLGSMGKRRIRNLQQLGVKEIIGFDLNEDRRKEVEKLYHIPTISNIEKGLMEKLDCMVISTPPDLHYMYAKIAIKNKLFMTNLKPVQKKVHKKIEVSSKVSKINNKKRKIIPSRRLTRLSKSEPKIYPI